MHAGPLTGVTVLELGSLISGPFASRILGDFGARVIKVEPLGGDPLRQWGVPATQDSSYWSLVQSRNKDLVAINLYDPRGQEIVRRLAGHVDVVLENFRPGRLHEWGIGYDELSTLYPSLIMVSVSGYGQTGPYRDLPGFGNIAESMGGLRAVTGFPDGPPVRVGVSLGDQIASLYAVIGALLALFRQRDGNGGDHVDVALTEAVLSFMEGAIPEYVHAGVVPGRRGNVLGRAAPSGVYPCRDENWVSIGANGDSIFKRFAMAIGRSDWAEDPDLAMNRGRVARLTEIEAGIRGFTETHDSRDVVRILREASVPVGPVYTIREIVEDPAFQARGMVTRVPSAELAADLAVPGVVPRLLRHPGGVDRPGGRIGRDTGRVLGGLLGMPDEEIHALARAGVVRWPEAETGEAESKNG